MKKVFYSVNQHFGGVHTNYSSWYLLPGWALFLWSLIFEMIVVDFLKFTFIWKSSLFQSIMSFWTCEKFGLLLPIQKLNVDFIEDAVSVLYFSVKFIESVKKDNLDNFSVCIKTFFILKHDLKSVKKLSYFSRLILERHIYVDIA